MRNPLFLARVRLSIMEDQTDRLLELPRIGRIEKARLIGKLDALAGAIKIVKALEQELEQENQQ